MAKANSVDRDDDIEEGWDLESAELRPAVKSKSVVVSVRLRRDDFDRIAERAELAGIPVSTFMRTAALRELRPQSIRSTVYWSGSAEANFTTSAIFGHSTSADLAATRLDKDS